MLAGAALAASACARAPQPPVPDRLQRVLAALGPSEFITLDAETRPATLLAPGEVRRCRATVAPGSQLDFAIGIMEGAPAEGSVRISVESEGRALAQETLPVGRRRWLNRSVAFAAPGELALEFKAELIGAESAGSGRFIALASARVEPPPRARRPRLLVWISQDTVRADHLGAYGYGRSTSPNFDRLARGFTVFEQAVSAASWTLPSLTSQMTSRYPSFHGATQATKAADARYPTLFETLANDGFTVLGVTGNPFISDKYALARGFDALVYTGLKADVVSRLARQYSDQWNGGDLALFVHFMDPHSPYRPPEEYRDKFGPAYDGAVDGFNYRSAAKTDADVERVRALYDGELAWTDHEIAGLLAALSQKGLLDQAVIAYSADHGDEFMDHGSWGHAHTLYEELLHVPFALRVPGARARRVAEPVSLVDLAPTLLEALRVPAPASYQGRSLLPLVHGATLPELPLFAETARFKTSHKVAVRLGRFKYIEELMEPEGKALQKARELLFDLEADPKESGGEPSGAELERLRREVAGFLARAQAADVHGQAARIDPEDEEALRALGYVN